MNSSQNPNINYRKGSILKIHVKNFVTYDEVICEPGPNLNIIIGPNGTGKSTIVAAIILGLGGTPKTIGRGLKIGEYVRNNCTEAIINIDLCGDNISDIYVITRQFNTDSHTKWFINHKNCSEQDVKKLIQKFDIQVNNLCQFLPQDRVQDFAKMSKKELLINTQVAVGRQDLVEKQKEIINLQQQIATLSKDRDKIVRELEQTESDMSRLEGRVRNYKERKIFMKDIEHIDRKLSWKNHENLTKQVQEVHDDLLKANKVLEKCNKKLLPFEKQMKTLNNEFNEKQKVATISVNTVKMNEQHANIAVDQLEEIRNTQREHLCEMNVKIKDIEHSTTEIKQMEQKIDKLINDEQDYIQQHGNDNEIDAKVQKINAELIKFNQIINDSDQKRIDNLRELRRIQEKIASIDNRIQNLQNLKDKRLDILRQKDSDAYQAVMWLRKNKHLFQSNIYEPIMVELDVFNKDHSKYLESIISMRDKVAFTCESHEDMNLLVQKLREEMGLSINVLHSGPEHPGLATYKDPVPIEQIRQYGFYAYIRNLINGPEAVMKYLCRMYRIHNIPIGDDKTFHLQERVPADFKMFFSTNHRFIRAISRYTNEVSSRITLITSDGTLSTFINQHEIHNLHKDLNSYKQEENEYKQKIVECDNKKTKVKDFRMKLVEETRNFLKIKEDLKVIRTRLKSTKTNLENLIQNSPKEDEIKEKYKNKIKDSLKIYINKHISLQNTLQSLSEHIKKKEIIHIQMNNIRQLINHVDNETQTIREEYNTAKLTADKIEQVHKQRKIETKNAFITAKKLSDGYTPDDEGFDIFREKYNSLPKEEEGLEQLKEELQIKIRLMTTANDDEIQEYERGLRLINNYKKLLDDKRPSLENIKVQQKKLYEEWIVPLEELVGQINKNFSQYFESMGCAGEVQINKDKGVEKITDYELSIKVTYRADDTLQELNRHVQSGGERAVATAVFMLSMQDLTSVPFRCVDEINQGMDPQNERRIFEILVKATCKPDTCQYFLVTPKLISDLTFGRNMKIHIIHNAQFIKTLLGVNLENILNG